MNEKQELVDSDTKETLGTQTTAKKYGVQALPEADEEEVFERRLDCQYGGDIDCQSEEGGSGYVIIDTGNRNNGACNSIRRDCEDGKTVDIYRTFSNGEEVIINICGPTTKVGVNGNNGLTTFRSPGVTKVFMQMTKQGCKFNGADLTQQRGETCDTGSDCARGHKCYKMSERSVQQCQSKFCRNFDKIRHQNRCAESCRGNTCELISSNLVLAGTTDDPTLLPSFSPTPRPTNRPTRTNRPSKPNSVPTTNRPTRKTPVPTRKPNWVPTPPPTQPMCERLPNDNGIVRTLQNLLWTEKPQEGLLLQTPDYLSQGWRAMSHLNNHLMATNPVYPITAYTSTTCPVPTDKFGNGCFDEGGTCPYNGLSSNQPCDDPSKYWRDVNCDGYDSDPTWDYAPVSLVYGTNYEQNSNRAEYNVNGAKARVNVCYPTDANSVDGRVRDDGVATSDTEGLGGCHTDDPTLGLKKVDQDYVCDKSTGKCLTGSTNCKCWYDGVPGKQAGEWITKYSEKICGLGEK